MPKTKKEDLVNSIKSRLSPQEAKPEYISTSSPQLDYYLSDVLPGGFRVGKVVNIVGDSHAGKTLKVLTCLAEAVNNPAFDDYNIVYDDCEAACEFDVKLLFGDKLYQRMRSPKESTDKHLGASETVEELYQNVLAWLDLDKPVIYVVDSLDSLKTKEDDVRAKQFQKKGDADGSYSMSKPKLMSEMLRVITGKVKQTRSFVFIISQVRDKIGVTFGKKYSRAGGKALDFYCSYIIWLAHKQNITEEAEGIKVQTGNISIVKITKNKITGKRREVELPIYYDYGIDGITSAVEFLIKTGDIPKNTANGKKYILKENEELFKYELIEKIDADNWYKQWLLKTVASTCKRIDDQVKITRKPKYE